MNYRGPDFRQTSLADLRAKISARLAQIEKREQQARNEIDACARDRLAENEKLKAVERAEAALAQVYNGQAPDTSETPESVFTPEDPISQPRGETLQRRLRIGDQRYRKLHTVRMFGPLSDSDVADATGLGLQRVRDQLQADAELGVLNGGSGRYVLTEEGKLLMERFEQNRKSMGKPLPAIDGPTSGSLPLGPKHQQQEGDRRA